MSDVPSHLTAWGILDESHSERYGRLIAIRCPCGSDRLILSHSGSVYEHRGQPLPLGVKIGDWYDFIVYATCAACSRQQCLFECGLHGWTGLLGLDGRRPAGQMPAPKTWHCSGCGSVEHRGAMQYTLPAEEDFEYAVLPTHPMASWADAFVWLGMDITCYQCGLYTCLWFEAETFS
jgi:hypothetical protein